MQDVRGLHCAVHRVDGGMVTKLFCRGNDDRFRKVAQQDLIGLAVPEVIDRHNASAMKVLQACKSSTEQRGPEPHGQANR